MSEAPERIWAFPIKDWFRGGCSTHKIIERKYARDVEYIRADIHEARIKELETQVTWQPIETAPKDGTVIFVWHEPGIKHYSAFKNEIKKARWLNDLEEWCVESVGGNIAPTVTQWMPLPSAPKQHKEDET